VETELLSPNMQAIYLLLKNLESLCNWTDNLASHQTDLVPFHFSCNVLIPHLTVQIFPMGVMGTNDEHI
jgi:hypothetical protein